jgi:hypothetical protein
MLHTRKPTEDDLKFLAECHSLDEWHKDGDATVEDWMNCAGGLTAFYDEVGVVFVMAFTEQGRTLRLHSQFDPREHMRTARNIIRALEIISGLAVTRGFNTLAIWSKSPKLIEFMKGLGFAKEGEDYVLHLPRMKTEVIN